MPKRKNPYTRSSTGHRITRKRRRVKKRYPRKKALGLKIHTFSERAPDSIHSLNDSTLTNQAGNLGSSLSSTIASSFQISDLAQFDHYKELFEYYMLHKVVVTFRYKTAGAYARASTTDALVPNEINPTLFFKVDHNDIVGDSLAVMKESSRTHEKQLTNSNPKFTITLKPAVQSMNYASITATAYIPKWRVWLNTTDDQVPHYGLKVQVQCPTKSSVIDYGSILIEKKYYFSCKNNE